MAISALFAYNQNSAGSEELATALGIKRIRHRGSKFVGTPTKTIINWGATPDKVQGAFGNARVLNDPQAVQRAVSKDETFRIFRDRGVPHPEWTSEQAIAQQWCERGHFVFARTQLRASSGRGISVMDPDHPDTWNVRANLYVKYVKKQHEYRIHVFRGRVIDTQRKALRDEFRGQQDVNWKIRNLANGFVFVRNDANGERHEVPEAVNQAAIQSVEALGLDFGAADVIWNARAGQAYVLEVNTAPGLQGQTVTSYAEAFRGL